MHQSRRIILVAAAVLAGLLSTGCGSTDPRPRVEPGSAGSAGSAGSDRWIAQFAGDQEPLLRASAVPIWDREEGVVLAGPSTSQLESLRAEGVEPTFRAKDHGEAIHVLSHDRWFTPPDLPGVPRSRINDGAMLYLIPPTLQLDLPRLKLHGLFHGVPRVALPPVQRHPAEVNARPVSTAALPLVQQIVDSTSQASWYQFVRDLSGDSDVTIPGYCTACRIRTRASNYMFPINNTGTPLGNPFATEYLESKAAGWGFTAPNAARESYTSASSGCTTRQGGQTWQNVVFTLPAQVDYAQSQQVIFLVHYDSISESAANDANNSTGADDAISGGSALLEAMRLFKDYAWQYPVKFLFVSGEEVGLCGSTAYTRMHPTAPMWRVLNMDQTAFDGNKNGLMNLYNWSTTSCPSCVAFGDAFVQANADYGNIIDPAKIVRNTTKMCQTDHCPFWNVGVTAIDLNEDLTNNDICPCFDQLQSATCRDTVTQVYPIGGTTLMFDQNYSWPTEKAAIALIAHTATPLYACPAAGATLGATSTANQVQLTWPAVPPVTSYVIERASGGCSGAFSGIAATPTPAYSDTAVAVGATYGYRVRTCPFQVSNCVEQLIQSATATAVTSAPNPSTLGQAVTFTATVTGSGGVPVGSVLFQEGATILANVTVDGAGHASFSTAALALGSHTITATFTGAAGWLGSSGSDAASPQVVNPTAAGSTATALVASPSPSALGQPVTLTATVSTVPPGGGTPTGLVTFLDGAAPLGQATLSGGVAALSTSALGVGSHSLTASYGGDAAFAPSSGGATQVVNNDLVLTFTSVATQDGWVLESRENSNVGGSLSSTASSTSALRVGDDSSRRQYKAVVSFDTSPLPDGATVVSATLRLLRGASSGANPFTSFGACWVDVQSGSGLSGSTALQTSDFQASATAVRAASLSNAAANGTWSTGGLNAAGLSTINKTGTTQLRVYFNLDDNNNSTADYIGYYSGDNKTAGNRPQLVVTYY